MNLEHITSSPHWNDWASAFYTSRNCTRFEEDHEHLNPANVQVVRDVEHLVELVTALDDRGVLREHADATAFTLRDVMLLKTGAGHLWELSKGGAMVEVISIDSYCGFQSATSEVIQSERDFLRDKIETALKE